MTQNNFRKEPVFGEPLTTNVEENEIIDSSNSPDTHNKPYVSLHSNQSPGYTFTPVMKRPETVSEGDVVEPVKSTKEFAFTPSADSHQPETVNVEVASSAINSDVQIERVDSVTTQENITQPTTEGFTTERIIPSATTATSATVATTVATAATLSATDAVAKIPPKTRRLLLVALLALVLLVIFFLLKPSTPETVEELQSQQGSSLPIEFRPVDEAEAKRAEEQARAEQEAVARAQEEQAKALEQAQKVAQSEQTVTNQTQASVEQPVVVKAVESKPVAQVATKPQIQGSVVYQPETPAKPQPKAQSKPERAQPAVKDNKVVAKPAQEKVPAKVETAKTTVSSTVATSTKTMTVPKGVSLMQVFRDNNLNIADVNAMSKVNNIVSNLKVGERVTVRLDKNNRVVEMSLSSGGKFTRQANGNYTFK